MEISNRKGKIPVRIRLHNRAAANATPRQNAEPFWRSRERSFDGTRTPLSSSLLLSLSLYPSLSCVKPESRGVDRESTVESRTPTRHLSRISSWSSNTCFWRFSTLSFEIISFSFFHIPMLISILALSIQKELSELKIQRIERSEDYYYPGNPKHLAS